jgi:hypothetical protein
MIGVEGRGGAQLDAHYRLAATLRINSAGFSFVFLRSVALEFPAGGAGGQAGGSWKGR